MRNPTARRWLALALGTGVMAGCQSGAARHSYANDPLILSKRPVDGKPGPAGRPVLVAQADPAPPAMPTSAVAQASPTKPATADGRGPDLPAEAATEAATAPKPSVEATPAGREKEAGPFTGKSVARTVDGVYGHAADYSWLQGVVDRHYLGYLTLRYCDLATDDPWGGKVILDEDPRLAQFHDGDVVQVEGELVHRVPDSTRHAWDQNPHYHLRDIRLVKRAR